MADSQNPVVSETEANAEVKDEVQVDAVQNDQAAATTADNSGSTRTRTKKLVFPVPEEKLTYPFQDGIEEWTVKHGKLKEDDFQTLEAFETWLAEDYFEKKISRLREIFEEKIQPLLADQENLRVRLRESKRICEALNITDTAQKTAIAETLGMASVAANAGVSFEDLLNAMSMLNQAKAENSEDTASEG